MIFAFLFMLSLIPESTLIHELTKYPTLPYFAGIRTAKKCMPLHAASKNIWFDHTWFMLWNWKSEGSKQQNEWVNNIYICILIIFINILGALTNCIEPLRIGGMSFFIVKSVQVQIWTAGIFYIWSPKPIVPVLLRFFLGRCSLSYDAQHEVFSCNE